MIANWIWKDVGKKKAGLQTEKWQGGVSEFRMT